MTISPTAATHFLTGAIVSTLNMSSRLSSGALNWAITSMHSPNGVCQKKHLSLIAMILPQCRKFTGEKKKRLSTPAGDAVEPNQGYLDH